MKKNINVDPQLIEYLETKYTIHRDVLAWDDVERARLEGALQVIDLIKAVRKETTS